ncbi:MAG: hypothetical protein K6E40_02170 [Desulfovibrio sp.]|nr:hypothetical protein [Desulfovibrio sp.]
MIRTVSEAFWAMHGREPDKATAIRLARILVAIGCTRERDPVAGLLVLLDAYYGAVYADAKAVRQARDAVLETLASVRTKDEKIARKERDEILKSLSTLEGRLARIETMIESLLSQQATTRVEAQDAPIIVEQPPSSWTCRAWQWTKAFFMNP